YHNVRSTFWRGQQLKQRCRRKQKEERVAPGMPWPFDDALRVDVPFFTFCFSNVDDFAGQVIHGSRGSRDFLNLDVELGVTDELSRPLGFDYSSDNARSRRDQYRSWTACGPNVIRERQKKRFFFLNFFRVEIFVQNDRKNGPFWHHKFLRSRR